MITRVAISAHNTNSQMTFLLMLPGLALAGLLLSGCLPNNVEDRTEYRVITVEDLEARERSATEIAPDAVAAIERMTDAQICSEIQKENYTGTKFICLTVGSYTSKGISSCEKWSEERVGKDSFIEELNRRSMRSEDCDSIIRRSEESENSPSKYVLLDSSEPAYCLMYGFSEIEFLLKFKRIPRDRLVQMTLDIEQLKDDPERYLDSCVIENEYQRFDYRVYMPRLLELNKGTPFGLTWNGGLAFTRKDYWTAQKRYDSYQSDPEDYLKNSTPGSPGDRINPGAHLPFFLH